MAISLDYMGKYIIMMVAILVAIGLIFTMKGQIMNSLGDFWPGEDEGPEQVTISKDTDQARAQKIADLIQQCYEGKVGSGIEDKTCYIINKDSGSFSLGKSDIKDLLKSSLEDKVEFKADSYDRETIMINWDSKADKILVEKP